MCRSIVKLLRNANATQNPYRNLYMDYLAYGSQQICKIKQIIIPAGLSKSGITSVDQEACTCFNRLAVIDGSAYDYQYFEQISITAGKNNSVIVLQCVQDICVLLERYEHTEWGPNFTVISPIILTAPVPISQYSSMTALHTALFFSQEMFCQMRYLLIFQFN